MEEDDVMAAMRWAEQTGEFNPSQIQDFHEMIRMLQTVSVPSSHLSGGRYLDEGAFGNIEKASFHGSKVAVKYARPSAGKALAQTFREVKLELQVVQQLRHPSIVSFMGSAARFPRDRHEDPNDWTVGLIFELCEGGQLNKLLHNADNTPNFRFTSAEKLQMAKDVSIGLSYLHSLRIIHRDLSTRNLLLTADKKVKICDFGCARKVMRESYSSTTISGSPPWMAPEQIKGEDLTLKTDVFSFGTILWEFATERIPHFQVRDNLQALAEAISGQGPQPKFSESEHLQDMPMQLRKQYERLLTLVHKQTPFLRPSAEQCRQVLESLEVAINGSNNTSPASKAKHQDHEGLLNDLEGRVDFAERLHAFYMRHNPERVQYLGAVLDRFPPGTEDKLLAEMRKKYNADLYGEYPEQQTQETGPRRQEYKEGRRPDTESPEISRPKRRLSDDVFVGIAGRYAGVDDRRGRLPGGDQFVSPFGVMDAEIPAPRRMGEFFHDGGPAVFADFMPPPMMDMHTRHVPAPKRFVADEPFGMADWSVHGAPVRVNAEDHHFFDGVIARPPGPGPLPVGHPKHTIDNEILRGFPAGSRIVGSGTHVSNSPMSSSSFRRGSAPPLFPGPSRSPLRLPTSPMGRPTPPMGPPAGVRMRAPNTSMGGPAMPFPPGLHFPPPPPPGGLGRPFF